MRNPHNRKDESRRESEYQKFFDDAIKKLRETGDIDIVNEILKGEAEAKPTPIRFPYGGKRYNNWVAS